MQEHEKWLKIAKEDLKAAKTLLRVELFSTVVYHCQQSAEKSLKAYLVFKNKPIIKIHDLINLLELCIAIDKDFKKKFIQVDYINPFSTKFRYPTEFDIPDFKESELAIKHAQNIMNFVIKKIAEPKTGQTSLV